MAAPAIVRAVTDSPLASHPRPALFLDRDGVLNEDRGYVCRWDDFCWIPGARETVAAFNRAGWLVIVVTNQSGVGRGYYTEAEMHALHAQMVEDLAQVEKDRAVILAGISHDLRTPLARMQLEVEMASLPEEAREGMQSDINQMDAIIGQFLDYAKPTDASTFVAVNLSEMLADVGREAARIRDLRVKTDLMPGVHVLGNATDLRRVFNNIIENARRYGKTPGADYTEITILLRVKSTAHGRCAVVDICDHGVGVPEDQIAQLLKPFTRLDTARGQANGAGLGLAIVERVLTRHNAQLTVRNRDEGGLLLQIALPLAG